MRIPGIPGGSEPSFRTRDAQWMGLDTLVLETCARLESYGTPISPVSAKATIQVARQIVEDREGMDSEDLIAEVVLNLRPRRVVMTGRHVSQILTAYGHLVIELGIDEVNEPMR